MSETPGQVVYEAVAAEFGSYASWATTTDEHHVRWDRIGRAVQEAFDAQRDAEDDEAWAEVGDRLSQLEWIAMEHDDRLDRLERWRAGEVRRAIAGGDPLRRADGGRRERAHDREGAGQDPPPGTATDGRGGRGMRCKTCPAHYDTPLGHTMTITHTWTTPPTVVQVDFRECCACCARRYARSEVPTEGWLCHDCETARDRVRWYPALVEDGA